MTNRICYPLGGAGHSLTTRVPSASSSDFLSAKGTKWGLMGAKKQYPLKIASPIRSDELSHLHWEVGLRGEAVIG